VVQSSVNVTGAVADDQGELVDARVDLRVNGVSQGQTNTSGGFFSYANVTLNPGVNVFSGSTRRTIGGQLVTSPLTTQQVERRNDLTPRGRQEVVFNFQPIADTRLREIAAGTLSPQPSQAQLAQFVAAVKTETREFFTRLYQPFNVVLVDQPTPGGGGVVSVTFEDRAADLPGAFGSTIPSPASDVFNLMQAVPDFNNRNKTQIARVFVGNFKQVMVDQNQLLGATAALATDSLQQRAEQVSNALGRTAVHEVAHTLGLVSQGNLVTELAVSQGIDPGLAQFIAALLGIPNPLPELQGCRQAHNCPTVDANNPLADRFGDGFFIMDPGELVPLFARIGFAAPNSRAQRLPRFNNFNASYLRIIHPKP
jgi:hypothetical protein